MAASGKLEFPPDDAGFDGFTVDIDVPSAERLKFRSSPVAGTPPAPETASSAASTVEGRVSASGASEDCLTAARAKYDAAIGQLDSEDEQRLYSIEESYAAETEAYASDDWDSPEKVSIWYPALLDYYQAYLDDNAWYAGRFDSIYREYALDEYSCYTEDLDESDCDGWLAACQVNADNERARLVRVAGQTHAGSLDYISNVLDLELSYSEALYNEARAGEDRRHEDVIGSLDPGDPDYSSKKAAEDTLHQETISELQADRDGRNHDARTASTSSTTEANRAYQDAVSTAESAHSAAISACSSAYSTCMATAPALCMVDLRALYGCTGEWALTLPMVNPYTHAPYLAPCNCPDTPTCKCIHVEGRECECHHGDITSVEVSATVYCASSCRASLTTDVQLTDVDVGGALALACSPDKDPERERGREIILHADNERREAERHRRALEALVPGTPSYPSQYKAESEFNAHNVVRENRRHQDVLDRLDYPACREWTEQSAYTYISSCFDDSGAPDKACADDYLSRNFGGSVPPNLLVLSSVGRSAPISFRDVVYNTGSSENDDCSSLDSDLEAALRRIGEAFNAAVSAAESLRDARIGIENSRHASARDAEERRNSDTLEGISDRYDAAVQDCGSTFMDCYASAVSDEGRAECQDAYSGCLLEAALEMERNTGYESARHDAAVEAEDLAHRQNIDEIDGDYAAAVFAAENARDADIASAEADYNSAVASCSGSSGGTLPSVCAWGGPARGNDIGPRIASALADAYNSVSFSVPDTYFIICTARARQFVTATLGWTSTYTLGNGGGSISESNDPDSPYSKLKYSPGTSLSVVPGVYDWCQRTSPSAECKFDPLSKKFGEVTGHFSGSADSDSADMLIITAGDTSGHGIPPGECGVTVGGAVLLSGLPVSQDTLPVVGRATFTVPQFYGGALHELDSEDSEDSEDSDASRHMSVEYFFDGDIAVGCESCVDNKCGCDSTHWEFAGSAPGKDPHTVCPDCLVDDIPEDMLESCTPPPCEPSDEKRRKCIEVCGDETHPPGCHSQAGLHICHADELSITCPDDDD